MTRFRTPGIHSLFAASLFLTVSAAAAEKNHCGCAPGLLEEFCTCQWEYTLGRSATVEFRGFCDGSGTEDRPDMIVKGRDSATSCTVQLPIKGNAPGNHDGPYMSKSCTNWNPFKTDHIVLETRCYRQE